MPLEPAGRPDVFVACDDLRRGRLPAVVGLLLHHQGAGVQRQLEGQGIALEDLSSSRNLGTPLQPPDAEERFLATHAAATHAAATHAAASGASTSA